VTTSAAAVPRQDLVQLGVIGDRDSALLTAVATALVAALGVLSSLAWLVFRPASLGEHAGWTLAISAASLLVAVVVWRRPELLPAGRLNLVAVVATLGLALVAYLVGAELFPYVTLFYVWVGCSVPFWSRRRGIGHLLLVFLVYAVVLAVQPGHPAPVAQWAIFVGTVAVAGGVVDWVVQRIAAVALDQRRSRLELEEASARLEVVNSHKREFLAATSHELRTPLNAIIGFSDVLSEQVYGPLNERQAEYVEDIRASGQHLLGLIGDVLDLAKVESGRVELQITEVDLATLLAGAVNLFKEQAARRSVELLLQTDGPVRIEADERKLRQVVVNLIANAVEHTPTGGRVRVRARSERDRIEVSVTDTGAGIAPEDQERIFEAYEQGSRPGKAGTGLGLAVARRLVEAHGGRLHLRSALGAGSTFAFTLSRSHPLAVVGGRAPDQGTDAPVATDALMRQTTRVATFFSLWGAGLVGLAGILLALDGDPLPGYRPGSVVALGLVGALVGLVLIRFERALTARHYMGLCVVFIGVLTGGALFAGPFVSPFGAVAYTWAALTTFMLLPVRQALPMAAVVVAAHGLLVTVQDGNSLPLMRGLLVAGACAGCGALMAWLMGKLQDLMAAEHEARGAVERSWFELDQVSRHKTEFLANMSHELRTPLNAVIGFADVLHEQLFGPLTPKQAEYLEDIMDAGRQLLTLINDILDLAKAEAGHVELRLDDVALGDLVQSAIDGQAAEVDDRHLRVAVELDPAAHIVRADSLRLGRAVANLLSNAVKYSPDGGEIDVRAVRDNGEVIVAVRDRGPGIARADQDRIFDEFQQGSPASLASPGTGLGLALARTFAELHHGRVEVESEPGHGSTFRLAIPQPT
jgi:signal transduction histidine kinase